MKYQLYINDQTEPTAAFENYADAFMFAIDQLRRQGAVQIVRIGRDHETIRILES